ncbi:MAG: hypothetical protein HYY40_14350 [Bacteroidetes bacterium]|nr:hypothetical protein [Bacteroidota bacterium]
MKVIIPLLFFLLINLLSFADCHLALKKGHKKISVFLENDEITYLLNGRWSTGKIDSICDGFFIIHGVEIFLKDIQSVKIIRKSLNYREGGCMLIMGGIFFTTVELFNEVVNGEKPYISASTGILSSLFIFNGIIFELMSERKFILGEKFTLETICL